MRARMQLGLMGLASVVLSLSCSGSDGKNGTDGTNGIAGTSGFDSLVLTTAFTAGGGSSADNLACPYGGVEIDSGLDNGAGGGVARDGICKRARSPARAMPAMATTEPTAPTETRA